MLCSTGFSDNITPEIIRGDVILTNSPGIHTIPIAESVIAAMLDHYGYSAQIIAAAVRNSRQIADAAAAGAHCVTAAMAVYEDSFRNPYTAMGERVFQEAWDATPQSDEPS